MERSVANLTGMFTENDFVTATQQIRDEILQLTAANVGGLAGFEVSPGTNQNIPCPTRPLRRAAHALRRR